jgi:hypothetical protein
LSWSEGKDIWAYWRKLKQRLKAEGSEVVTKCHGLKLMASDGKYYTTDVADTETMFRIIQSIPSPSAEPFKLWLARVWYERIEETEDPELWIPYKIISISDTVRIGLIRDWKPSKSEKHLPMNGKNEEYCTRNMPFLLMKSREPGHECAQESIKITNDLKRKSER